MIEREKAINRASEWVSQQNVEQNKTPLNKRTQFDIEGQMCNLKIANVILSSLAEAHQRVPFDSQPTGVEECASNILESMWSSHTAIPNAHSYAFFLKCLEGETPAEVTAKAQEVVNAMELGCSFNGRTLPKPDVSVYCSLTQLKALSGIDSLLETKNSEHYHRNMYLSMLSVMAHNPNMFDTKVATKCIDQMRTFSEKECDATLQPDIEVYNAPLRWSGGPLWTRHYSRVIPWDSYNEIYQHGFKPENAIDVDMKRNQAEEIEQWIEIMKKKALHDSTLSPNIETYESLIQAWVRCGSLECLFRAEACAKNLINGNYSDVKPRKIGRAHV